MNLPEHPRLLFNSRRVEELRDRVSTCRWAREYWEGIQKGLDARLDAPLEIPPRGGNWRHYYVSPETGRKLHPVGTSGPWEWEHAAHGETVTHSGSTADAARDYDACVIAGIHDELALESRWLAIAHQITGDGRYAQRARSILLGYARKYLAFQLHDINGDRKLGGGRVHPQALDESVWLIRMAHAADLVWDALSDADREELANGLFFPAAQEVIFPLNMGTHNQQVWFNAAMGLVGLLYDDDGLFREAIDHPERGHRALMRDAVLADGSWWEGSWGFHFYALQGVWPLVEAAQQCGTILYGKEIKRMFDAPLEYAMPNGRLPAFNDSEEVDLARYAALYELGYARFENEAYLGLLHDTDRGNEMALFFGRSELPPAVPCTLRSRNHVGAGYSILTEGSGPEAPWLCLKHGPHGGVHGHLDKLSFTVYSGGEVVSPDSGTCLQGHEAYYQWYPQSVAHNTLVVNETSQNEARGHTFGFGEIDGVSYVVAEAGDIYPDVDFRRAIALVNENLILVVDLVWCERTRRADIVYHQHGTWVDVPAGLDWLPPSKDGYGFLAHCSLHETRDGVSVMTRLESGRQPRVTLAAQGKTIAVTGYAPGQPVSSHVPVAIFRRRGKEISFAWCISLDGSKVPISHLPVRDQHREAVPSSVAVAVMLGDAAFCVNPDCHPVDVQMPDGEIWSARDVFQTRRQGAQR